MRALSELPELVDAGPSDREEAELQLAARHGPSSIMLNIDLVLK